MVFLIICKYIYPPLDNSVIIVPKNNKIGPTFLAGPILLYYEWILCISTQNKVYLCCIIIINE